MQVVDETVLYHGIHKVCERFEAVLSSLQRLRLLAAACLVYF